MTTTDFAKTIAARARARTQMLALEGHDQASRRDRAGATLERRIEVVLRAARSAGHIDGQSRIGTQVPKT
jgi:hypothetical protein